MKKVFVTVGGVLVGAILVSGVFTAGQKSAENVADVVAVPNVGSEPTTSAPTTAPTTTAATTTSGVALSAEDVFLYVLIDGREDLYWSMPDEDLIALGWQGCDVLAAAIGDGWTVDEMWNAAAAMWTSQGLSQDAMGDLAFTIGAASGSLCPEYGWFVN